MKIENYRAALQVVLLLGGVHLMPLAVASDVDDLTAMLHQFLSNADQPAAHRRFWADDLVYTSSAGTRIDKATILAGFDEEIPASETPEIAYSGDQVDVRIYGDTAIVAFRLVGTPADETQALHYFNTGTFLKRDGIWQVVAWQATKIPREPPDAE